MKFTYLHTIDKAYAGIAIVMASLSILSCFVIFSVLAGFKSLRTNGRTLLVCLTIANLLSCTSSIISASLAVFTPDLTYVTFPACAAASAISIVSNVCGYLWTCIISIYIYLCISWKKVDFADRIKGLYHLICWGFPVAVMVIATASDVVGFDFGNAKLERRPPWCWIDREADHFVMWELVTGLGWRIFTIVISTIFYSLVQFTLSVQGKPEEDDPDSDSVEDLTYRVQTANRKLRHIPLIFVVLYAWGAWQEMAAALSSTASWLVLMQVIGDNSQPLVNVFLLCVVSKDVRRKLHLWKETIRHSIMNRKLGLQPLELVQLKTSSEDNPQLLNEIEINEEHHV